MSNNADLDRICQAVNNVDTSELETPIAIPDRKKTVALIKLTQAILLPQFYHYKGLDQSQALEALSEQMEAQIYRALQMHSLDCSQCASLRDSFLGCLAQIKSDAMTDIRAIYNGDPSAPSLPEVVVCYPGFYAAFIYRIAHVLYSLGIPYIPRIMAEFAHEKTGIDINPGASIGRYFCIDHGTGVVIGETARIGSHVKLYQGVTIGARSFDKDSSGNPVKGGKRHPDIGDRVTIYANATILGGDTVIGDGCVIGANVWLTQSVGSGQKVFYTPQNRSRQRREQVF